MVWIGLGIRGQENRIKDSTSAFIEVDLKKKSTSMKAPVESLILGLSTRAWMK